MAGVPGGSSRQSSRPPLLLIGVLFVVSRLLVLPLQQPASEVSLYAQYAWEQDGASRTGVSFYELHAQAVQQQIEDARSSGDTPASLEEYKTVEYPPLALAVMRLPLLWMHGRPADGGLTPAFRAAYRTAYQRGMAVVDALLFALLLVLVSRFFAQESSMEQTGRLLAYVASTSALWLLLYDRQDLLLSLTMLLALVLLFSRLHYAWSFAVLALAVNFRLVPVVLAPVWIVGSLPGGERFSFLRPRVLAGLAVRTAVLLGLVAGCFLPFYLSEGSRCLGFLAYHQARGLEIGSLYSSLVMALQPLGLATHVYYSYGGINLGSSLSPVLAAVAPWLTAGLLLAATALLLAHGRQLARGGSGALAGGRLAHLHPLTFVCYTLLFLMLFIIANKVFSPQYLLWLAPLVVLVPMRRGGRRLFLWGFVLICALSTVAFPFLFMSDLVDQASARPIPFWTFKGPTVRVAVILGIRNGLLLGLAACLAVHLFRRARAPLAGPAPAGSGERVSGFSPKAAVSGEG
jgi:hypothetical protein